MLANLGYTFSAGDLEEWEVEAYKIVANTMRNEEEAELKRKKK